MKLTPNMKKALRQLAAGEPLRCGLPTKQRLVKHGLARWRPRASVEDVVEELRNAILTRDWHRPLEITDAGREALGLPVWTPSAPGWASERNDWGLSVYLDDDPILGEGWHWSAMRFANPGDDLDDRILTRSGRCQTKDEAMRAAEKAAGED